MRAQNNPVYPGNQKNNCKKHLNLRSWQSALKTEDKQAFAERSHKSTLFQPSPASHREAGLFPFCFSPLKSKGVFL
jgi:hypothetical protein